jgi:hypothetical protein
MRVPGWASDLSLYGRKMILFLDFDGVLHHENVSLKRCNPAARRYLKESDRRLLTCDGKLVKGKNLFEHADRLETCLEQFQDVRIVISSTWREHFRPEALLRFLPPALAIASSAIPLFVARIVRTRLSEVLAYMDGNGHAGEAWVALDDQERLFLDDDRVCPDNLFLLKGAEGLTPEAATALCDFLRGKLA